ncbi:hypothetical protein VKT23_016883 [Stygiomarasmius scandens]|uniref:Uncharacterized protein n=1 Tax=Marasmiellus scandens TaxID=2682957 RepID=A0ABR1IW52_9AGAR
MPVVMEAPAPRIPACVFSSSPSYPHQSRGLDWNVSVLAFGSVPALVFTISGSDMNPTHTHRLYRKDHPRTLLKTMMARYSWVVRRLGESPVRRLQRMNV